MTGGVRIGATHTFNIGLIPECTALFLARHPTVRVEELAAAQIGVKLHAGELDFGIAFRANDPSGLCFEPLYAEEMVLVVSCSYPLAGRKRIRMVELRQQRLVLMPDDFATRTLPDECFKASGAEPLVVAEMSTIAPMVAPSLRAQMGAIVAINAVPAGMTGLRRPRSKARRRSARRASCGGSKATKRRWYSRLPSSCARRRWARACARLGPVELIQSIK